MTRRHTDFPLVLIEWEDSSASSGSWAEISGDLQVDAPLICNSVGWLISDGERCVTIVPNIADASEELDARLQGCGPMTIPKSCILKQVTLI